MKLDEIAELNALNAAQTGKAGEWRGPPGEVGPAGPAGRDGEDGVGLPGKDGRDGIGPDEKVRLDAADPEAGFLADKLQAGVGIKFARRGSKAGDKLVIHAMAQGGAVPGATGPAGADAPSTLDLHLMGWTGSAWSPVLGDSTGRLVVTS